MSRSRILYIEKDAWINEDLQTLRQRAMQALVSRRDVIVVASVSCIYGLGAPDDFRDNVIGIYPGQTIDRDVLLKSL